MQLPTPPITPQSYRRTMKHDGQAVLTLTLRRPSLPERGKTARMERYFARLAQLWIQYAENRLFPQACRAYDRARDEGAPFAPWQAGLDYQITYCQPPLISMRLELIEGRPDGRTLRTYIGETWNCASGFPCTLRSLFRKQGRHWRRQLMAALCAQAEEQLTGGESLLDANCVQIMQRTFDADRFYLTDTGVAVFYPMHHLGPYAEGVPVFTVSLPTTA